VQRVRSTQVTLLVSEAANRYVTVETHLGSNAPRMDAQLLPELSLSNGRSNLKSAILFLIVTVEANHRALLLESPSVFCFELTLARGKSSE
jgi:hypothetical protein